MTHTPGPWTVEGDFVRDRTGLRIADCFADWKPDDRADADARLIAAAPDMLEALKFVLEHIVQPGMVLRDLYPIFGLNSRRAVELVEVAIAKATA